MPLVKMKISMASPTFSYMPGDLVLVNEAIAQEWIRIGHAEAFEESPTKVLELEKDNKEETSLLDVVEIPSLDEFAELKAEVQKDLLQQLSIEGDDSNADKRVVLYAAYLTEKEQSKGSAE